VATGLVGGSQTAMVLGFGAGLLLDLAPPADHAAGRWALALLLAGWVAGRVRADSTFAGATDAPALRGRPGPVGAAREGLAPRLPRLPQVLATVAGCSLLATTTFAATGLVLRDPATGAGDLVPVVVASVVLDLATALVLVPVAALLLRDRTARRSPWPGSARRDGADRVLTR